MFTTRSVRLIELLVQKVNRKTLEVWEMFGQNSCPDIRDKLHQQWALRLTQCWSAVNPQVVSPRVNGEVSRPGVGPDPGRRKHHVACSHMPTLMMYKLGFNRNNYTSTCLLLTQIVLCSLFTKPQLINHKYFQMRSCGQIHPGPFVRVSQSQLFRDVVNIWR